LDQKYDVARNVPKCAHPTVLSMLDIPDAPVFNCLVDQRGVESVILIRGDEQLRDIMHHEVKNILCDHFFVKYMNICILYIGNNVCI